MNGHVYTQMTRFAIRIAHVHVSDVTHTYRKFHPLSYILKRLILNFPFCGVISSERTNNKKKTHSH